MLGPANSMNPDSQNIHQLLQTASATDPTRSQTARLLDYLDSIETALNSGVSRASVIQILSANGFEISLNSFASALRRVRQRRARMGLHNSRSVQSPRKTLAHPSGESAVPVHVELDTSSSPVIAGSHNPSDLNKIFSQKPDLGALAKLAKNKHT